MSAVNNIRLYLSRFSSLFPRHRRSRNRYRVVVIGIGGCGGNLVSYVKCHSDMDFADIFCDGDIQNLNSRKDVIKIALDHNDNIETGIKRGAEIIFQQKPEAVIIAAGAGGRTSSALAPSLAEEIKERGILTFATVVTPFHNEGSASESASAKCISDLEEHTDGLFIINNQLLAESFSKASVSDYFDTISEMFTRFVECIAAMSRK